MREQSLRCSKLLTTAAVLLAALGASAAWARDQQQPSSPKEYRDLMACRAVTDSTGRLACFDRYAAQLDAATQSHQVVLADREAVNSAKRGLFGFTAPVAKLLGFGGSDADEIKEIDSKVARAGHTADGGSRLTLEDGSTWEQTDTRTFVRSPRIGDAVKITRGALGSFFVSVQGQRGLKMQRVQ